MTPGFPVPFCRVQSITKRWPRRSQTKSTTVLHHRPGRTHVRSHCGPYCPFLAASTLDPSFRRIAISRFDGRVTGSSLHRRNKEEDTCVEPHLGIHRYGGGTCEEAHTLMLGLVLVKSPTWPTYWTCKTLINAILSFPVYIYTVEKWNCNLVLGHIYKQKSSKPSLFFLLALFLCAGSQCSCDNEQNKITTLLVFFSFFAFIHFCFSKGQALASWSRGSSSPPQRRRLRPRG